MRKTKQIFTLIFFGFTMVITVATSKVKQGQVLDKFPDRITNYSVESTCPGSITEAKIRVNRAEIVDGSFPADHYPDDSAAALGHRSFEKFGFQYYYVNIGTDVHGNFELTGKDCNVKGRESMVNENYDTTMSSYWFYKTGFFTKTTYDCYDHNNYKCSIVFEELPAGEFSEISKTY
jgi:hypothetical protein